MKHGTFFSHDLKTTVKQVNITTARKSFYKGETIYIHPCKKVFDNCLCPPKEFNQGSINFVDEFSFDEFVNMFIYYNCNNEVGLYPNFFVVTNNK